MAKCTGRQLLKNPTLMQAVVNSRKAGVSVSAIARQFGISRDTIRAALAQPESSHFTRNTVERLERLVTKGLNRYERALDAGEVNPNSIPVHMGIALDKRVDLISEGTGKTPEQEGQSIASLLADLKRTKPAVQ